MANSGLQTVTAPEGLGCPLTICLNCVVNANSVKVSAENNKQTRGSTMSIVARFHAVSVVAALAAATTISAAAGPTAIESLHNCSEQTVELIYPPELYRKLLPPGFRFTGLHLTAHILV